MSVAHECLSLTIFASKRTIESIDAKRKGESIESKVKASHQASEMARSSAPPPPRPPSAPGVVEKGSKVRVLRGAFADKVGVVGEIDGRGGARVMLGLLSTKLDLADLELTGEARPALQSSHRRPLPSAPRKAR